MPGSENQEVKIRLAPKAPKEGLAEFLLPEKFGYLVELHAVWQANKIAEFSRLN